MDWSEAAKKFNENYEKVPRPIVYAFGVSVGIAIGYLVFEKLAPKPEAETLTLREFVPTPCRKCLERQQGGTPNWTEAIVYGDGVKDPDPHKIFTP